MRTALLLIAAAFAGFLGILGAQAQTFFPPEVQAGGQMKTQVSFLGVALADVDADRASRLKLKEERGVEVTSVEDGSPAESAGIERGDVLLTYNGEDILGAQQLVRLVRETPPGRKVKIQLWRNAKQQSVTADIGVSPGRSFGMPANFTGFDLPSGRNFPMMMEIPTPILVWKNTLLGVELEQLDQPLANYFGAKGGMLVRSVEKGSPAERAGLKVGDVIISIGSNSTLKARDLSSYFRSRHQAAQSTPIVAIRDHKEVTLNIAPVDNKE